MMHPVYRYRLTRMGTLRQLRQVRQLQWAPQAAVQAMRDQKLTELLRHAHGHVPYWREVLESCGAVTGGGHVDLAAFRRIPYLDKDTIRRRGSDLHSDAREWFFNSSGGSTGEPVRFVQEDEVGLGRALTLMYDEWSGQKIGERFALLWGSPRDLAEKPTWRSRYRRHTRRVLVMNAFAMTPERMRGFVRQINEFRPRQITAYAGSLYEFAVFIRREHLPVHSPAGVMISAESIYPEQRALIEEVFRAPVFDRYGSREAGNIACECDHHEGLHVSAPTHLVELLRDDGELAGPGEAGEIAVTCYDTFAMPLIRYRIGDRAAWADGPCSCGRAWPLLKEVSGRVNDAFRIPDGGTIDGCFFTMGFFGREWLERFQVVQETPDLVRAYLVLRQPVPPQDELERELAGYADHVRLVLPDAKVDFQIVDAIKPSPQGKHRYTISKLID
jgi:phenylacetate-CoA ligase